MDNEPEVTREQMQETRTALSEKLETLEQQVVDTVQGATNAVAESVENVKDAVHETVANVKDIFNLQLQVKRHPWGMVAGSIALGYLGGYLLFRRSSDRPRANDWSPPALPDRLQITRQQNGAVKGHRFVEQASRTKPGQEVSPSPPEPGWLSGVHNLFGTEITKLKGLVVGTVLGVVQDLIAQSVPEPMKPEMAEVMDSITVKLGGEPTRGPVLKDGSCIRGEAHQEHTSSEMGGLGATQRQGQTAGGTVA